jgi:hypothetical protein
MPKFVRDDEDWSRLLEAGREFLIERAKLGNFTSYTELNAVLERRIGLGFDFNQDGDRFAMGQLLGEISKEHMEETRQPFMISSLVYYLNQNDVGPGFYKEAIELGLLKPKQDRLMFWIDQHKAAFAYYSKK